MAINIGHSKLNLDFTVLHQSNAKYLLTVDVSQYITAPTGNVIDITVPGYSTPIRCSFDPSEVNVYNSGLLGLSSGSTLINLPDGVYTLTYRVCPVDVLYITKKIIRTCEIECKYLNLYAKFSLDCSYDNSENLKKLDKIKNYIESAKANASICNYLKAAEFIQKANNLLFDVDCHC